MSARPSRAKPTEQLALPLKERRKRGGRRPGAGRKPANPHARPNVPHRTRPTHAGRHPVHVTMRAARGVPGFRNELVRNLMRKVLEKQSKRAYASEFQVVHFSIQTDHVHLIVEAADGRALRRGLSGLAISFARRLNDLLRREGKVWGDRHHRRELLTPTDVRNTLQYVLQNWLRHGHKTFGDGIVDPYSSALRFDGWADEHANVVEARPWPEPRPRTWLLSRGWTRAGGLLHTSSMPAAARGVRHASIVVTYVPESR